MAKDADELVVAEDDNAAVFLSDVIDGSTLPTTEISALSSDWKEVGLITEDGARLRLERTITGIRSWQSKFDVRRIGNANVFAAVFAMQQWNEDTVPFAFGGGAVTEPTPGHFVYDVPDGGTDDRAMIIQYADGDKNYRVLVPRGNITETVESQLSRTAEAQLPVTFQALKVPGVPIARMLTDDPAWAEAS